MIAARIIAMLMQAAGATVEGRVSESGGGPVVGATVVIDRASMSGTTDSSGHFRLVGAPEGRWVLRVTAPGHRASETAVVIPPSGVIRIGVELVRMPTAVIPARSDSALLDTTRVTSLSAMRSEAPRIERQMFEQMPNVGRMSMGIDELKAAPRFFSEADLLRTVQLFPGVEARNDFSAGMNVRGGEADQNLVMLDGFPIYNPFHLGGLFGTFVEPMVGRVEVFTGAFPASYGNRLSSVLDVRSATEPRKGLHGTANVSLIASQLSLGSSMAEGMGSWKIAGRRTYIDQAVKRLTPEEVPYDFQDIQTFVTREFAGGLRASLTGYAGHDQFRQVNDDGSVEKFSWGNRVLGVAAAKSLAAPRSLGRLGSDSLLMEQRLSVSTFDADVDIIGGAATIRSPVRDLRASGVLAAFAPRHTRSLGWEVAHQDLRYESNFTIPIFPSDTQHQALVSAGLYYNDLWRPNASWVIDAGLRLDAVPDNEWAGLSPRLSAKYFVNPDRAFTAAVGQFAQWVRSIAREEVPVRPLDFWVASDARYPVSISRHYIVGTEGWIDRNRGYRVEGFLKTYRDLLERNPLDDQQRADDDYQRLDGHSLGFDVMLRHMRSQRFNGWIAYTFAVNTRRDSAGHSWSPAQDRRHDVNVVGTRLFRKGSIGFRYNYASGTPYTFITGSFTTERYDPVTKTFTTATEDVDFDHYLVDGRNDRRLPGTQRLDLSFVRDGHIRGVAVSPYLSVVNTTNAKNVFTYVFDYTQRPPTRTTVHQLSIVPTIGLAIAW